MKQERYFRVSNKTVIDLDNVKEVILNGATLSIYQYDTEFHTSVDCDNETSAAIWLDQITQALNKYENQSNNGIDWYMVVAFILASLTANVIYYTIKYFIS